MTTQCWGTIRLSLPLSSLCVCVSITLTLFRPNVLYPDFSRLCLDSVETDCSVYLASECVECLSDQLSYEFSLSFSRLILYVGKRNYYKPKQCLYVHLDMHIDWTESPQAKIYKPASMVI